MVHFIGALTPNIIQMMFLDPIQVNRMARPVKQLNVVNEQVQIPVGKLCYWYTGATSPMLPDHMHQVLHTLIIKMAELFWSTQ